MTQTIEKLGLLRFSKERLSEELVDEMLPLWLEHYEEIAQYKDIELLPAMSIYYEAQKQGSLRVYTIRHETRLIGYEVFFVYQHPHYVNAREAVQDVLFLHPEMRKGSLGYKFMKWNDSQLEHDAVEVIFRCVSNKNDYSALLKRMGFIKHDIVFSRRVKSCQQQSQ